MEKAVSVSKEKKGVSDKEEIKENLDDENMPFDENSSVPDVKKVKFLNDMPQFVGQDMKEYGPYDKEQIVEVPLSIADLLIKQGVVESL